MVELPKQRQTAEWIGMKWGELSQRRIAKLLEMSRSTLRYAASGKGQKMKERVRQAALDNPRYGHRRIAVVLSRSTGHAVSRRNVQRLMQVLNLQVRTRRRRKWVARPAPQRSAEIKPDQRWAMDFVSDWCVGVKRQLRVLTMVDCFTRESLALVSGYSMPSVRVVAVLESLRQQGRRPEEIQVDNVLNARTFCSEDTTLVNSGRRGSLATTKRKLSDQKTSGFHVKRTPLNIMNTRSA